MDRPVVLVTRPVFEDLLNCLEDLLGQPLQFD